MVIHSICAAWERMRRNALCVLLSSDPSWTSRGPCGPGLLSRCALHAHSSDLIVIGLLYKAYPNGCQHRLQVLLMLRPYPVRGHRFFCSCFLGQLLFSNGVNNVYAEQCLTAGADCLQDKFFAQLKSSPNGFSVIAEFFGRGLLDAASISTARPAV